MTYPEVQFVAAPEDGAEVLFDFNDNFGEAPAQIMAGTFTLGTPSIEGDPDSLGVQYGAREVGFSLLIYGSRQAARETQALLARTFMLRRRGWLRVQMDEFSAPVWLRTYTPTPAELDFTLVSLGDEQPDAWQLEVTVAAEPFIRGERIELWSGTINNNPAHVTNPMGVTLPPVLGDAPAPLRITSELSRQHNQSDMLWSTAAVPDDYAPIVWQIGTADGWTPGLDLQDPESAPGFSAGSYRRITFASSEAMFARLGGPAPSSTPPGRYQVFLRAVSTGGTFAFRMGYRTDYQGDDFNASKVAIMDRAATSFLHAAWVDLGEFDFPRHRSSVDLAEVGGIPSVVLQVERLASISELIIDAFLLLPVDLGAVVDVEPWEKASTLVSEFAGQGPQANEDQVWDGDTETSVRVSPAGMVDAYVRPSNRGKFPVVRPGLTNRLTLIQQTRASVGDFLVSGNEDVIADIAFVSVSYQPRWLWLGDA